LAVSDEYGLRVYSVLETGLLNMFDFKDVFYPETYVNIEKIKWIDDDRLVAGGYIVDVTQ
jgi:hypothetical protein